MNQKGFDIKEALARVGKEEFLLHGFEGVSLRSLCKKAGVTTGAFYSYFKNKEELFSYLVEPMLKNFRNMYTDVVGKAMTDVKNNEGNELEAIEFICAHRDEFRLLFDCSAGTPYESFKEELLDDLFMNSYQACFDRYAGCHADPDVVRLFVRIKFAQYMELIYGKYPMDEVRRLIRIYAAFTESGFMRLIEQIKDENSRAETPGSFS